jgi:4-hydroxythreonine-4-phosphate dehydrogenase
MGDPAGVGPEVIVKALDDGAVRRLARWVVFGSDRALAAAARACAVPATWAEFPPHFASSTLASLGAGEVGVVDLCRSVGLDAATDFPRRADGSNGALSFESVLRAIALAQLPHDHPWHAAAVVTGPINKQAWSLAGHGKYPGHTELFAEAFHTAKYAMMFHAGAGASCSRGGGREQDAPAPPFHGAPGMNVILATVHRPLRNVPDALTTQRVLDTIELGASAMKHLGVASPRVGVCGLNPHAGEHGLLGEEDDAVIAPAVASARAQGIDATGPWPADTIFQGALAYEGKPPARFDLVVAMYHDQGLIPLKTLAWDRAVNFTVGLSHNARPVWRTSPDHGTAFDIAGTGAAHVGSMKAAMTLAVKLATSG